MLSVRGAGLLLAAQLSQPLAKEVSSAALSRGLLVNAVRPDAVRVAPPLLVTDDEIDTALAILAEVMTGVLAEPTTETLAAAPPPPPPSPEAEA